MDRIRIIPYADGYKRDYFEISRRWLEAYDLLEDADLVILNDPVGQVLEKGGQIYFAELNGVNAGVITLLPVDEDTSEIHKFGVNEEYRGLGLGKLLLEKVIAAARAEGKKRLVLCTNHRLAAAQKLYLACGFKVMPFTGSKYETADILMELRLDQAG